MADKITIQEDCEHELLDKMKSELNSRIRASTEQYKLYFSGDPSPDQIDQTEFERKSNHLEIGVLANDRTVALVLLRLVRIIVDENPDILLWDLEEMQGETPIGLVIEQLAMGEEQYMSEYDMNEALNITLYDFEGEGEVNIDRHYDDVDIWTFKRVMETILDHY